MTTAFIAKTSPSWLNATNVDVSSFGHSREEAVANLKEAVELCFEGVTPPAWEPVSEVSIGQEVIHA